jgi:hypothetical protein
LHAARRVDHLGLAIAAGEFAAGESEPVSAALYLCFTDKWGPADPRTHLSDPLCGSG